LRSTAALERFDEPVADESSDSTGYGYEPAPSSSRVAKESRLVISVPWRRVAELAQQIEDRIQAGHELETESIVKLARTVLLFQTQLLGVGVARRFLTRG
jgi:hypothetical protein